MVAHRVAGAPLDFGPLRTELAVPGDFASAVQADVADAIASLRLPDDDATDVPLVTLDPAGSRDLDQAVHIARSADGYVVHYAIADVSAFVRPGSATDEEAWRRGETLYFPDLAVPMLPPALCTDHASLLPDQLRPAVLWRIELDRTGEVRGFTVRRARVRSRAQFDYSTMQAALEAGDLPEALEGLPDVGALRARIARARHAIDLDLPEQIVRADGTGWRLELRAQTPMEQHNSQISLLTGMCAARLMLEHGYGILRTVPPPDDGAVRSLRRAAMALGVDWPTGAAPGDVLAELDRSSPIAIVLLEHAATLLRGAAYQSFAGAPPAQPMHAGIGASYAHATAPLRRLVDRYVSEICLAHAANQPVPTWVHDRLDQLPSAMAQADQRAHAADRAVVDATEAALLQHRVGQTFHVLVIDADDHAGTVMVDEPPVRARCSGERLEVGSHIAARVMVADVATRTVRFESGAQLTGEQRHG